MQLKIGDTIKHTLLLLIFIFHLLPGHISLANLVLCIGTDGHVAYESATKLATCAEAISHPSLPAETSFSALHNAFTPNHCGECIDLPLIIECNEYSKVQSQHSSLRSLQPLLKISPADDITAFNVQHRVIDINHSVFQHTSLISLRTTVLLI